MDDLIEKVKAQWNNAEELSLLLLEIVKEHQQTAQDLADAITSFAQAFVSEKEEGWKMTIAEAEHKAKALTGGRHEVLRAQLQSLVLLHQSASQRVNHLYHLFQNKPS